MRGETIASFLVGVLVSAVLLSAAVSGLTTFSRSSNDHRQVSDTEIAARKILDEMSYELRLAGGGIPFYLSNFQIGDSTLGNSPLPILTSASQTEISFRINQRGRVGVLSSQFDPSTSQNISLVDATGFSVGQSIYLTSVAPNSPNGLHGIIQSVVGSIVTIQANPVYSAGAIFQPGTLAQPVNLITYRSDESGISRIDGENVYSLSANSSFSLEYLGNDSTALSLPLNETMIRTLLSSIRVTVTTESNLPMTGGNTRSAQLDSRVSLRGLNALR